MYSDNSINKLLTIGEATSAVALTTRHVYRYISGDDLLIQAGGAFSFRTVDGSDKLVTPATINFNSEGFSPIIGENIIGVTVDNAKYNVKSNIELLAYYKRWLIQAEYLRADVIRTNDKPQYSINGGYLQLSYLVRKGGGYQYDYDLAIMTRPDKGAMELVTRVDYLNANNSSSGIFGGEHTDVSVGFNYFFHKFLAIKLNANYTFADNNVNPIFTQDGFSTTLRLQFVF